MKNLFFIIMNENCLVLQACWIIFSTHSTVWTVSTFWDHFTTLKKKWIPHHKPKAASKWNGGGEVMRQTQQRAEGQRAGHRDQWQIPHLLSWWSLTWRQPRVSLWTLEQKQGHKVRMSGTQCIYNLLLTRTSRYNHTSKIVYIKILILRGPKISMQNKACITCRLQCLITWFTLYVYKNVREPLR